MPRLSAFTPCGALRMSSQPSEVEKIYRALVASLGGDGANYAIQPGTREDGWCYATARTFANVRLTLIHAGLQKHPPAVTEFIADREAEWQIIPGPTDTLQQRRATLAARFVLPRGARREAALDALTSLLGTDFLAYITTPRSGIVNWPTTCGAQPQNLQPAGVPRKILRIGQPISFNLGSPQSVPYTALAPTQEELLVDDELVVDPGNITRAEVVTVAAVGPGTFTATFDNPHDNGSLATTQPFPLWVSSQRWNTVVVSATAAVDPETRRKLNELLERLLRGVSTWSIVAATTAHSAGPFIVGESPLGATPFGLLTWP